MHLYLVRHGQSYINLPDYADLHEDTALTELGERQADRVAPWLRAHIPQLDALYCSTLRRTRETARPISAAFGLQPTYEDSIREFGTNRADHTPWPNDDLPAYANFWGSSHPFDPISVNVPGGETFVHFRARVSIFVEQLLKRHKDQTVLVVCHGGVIEVAFDYCFNLDNSRPTEIRADNTSVTYFEHVDHPDRERWKLHYHNRTEHLLGDS